MNVAELRAELKRRHLDANGRKATLKQRLTDAMQQQQQQQQCGNGQTDEVQLQQQQQQSETVQTDAVQQQQQQQQSETVQTDAVQPQQQQQLHTLVPTEEPGITPVVISGMRVAELRAELQRRHLDANGQGYGFE